MFLSSPHEKYSAWQSVARLEDFYSENFYFNGEGKEEMGQKSMVVIISVIIFVTVALSKDLNINIDGNERRTKSVYEEQSQRSQN